MDPMRPYPANYAIGLLFVMSMHMLFNGVAALLYPSIFTTGYIGGDAFQYYYIGIGTTEFVMLLMLIARSGMAYKVTLALLIGLIGVNAFFLFSQINDGFDLGLQASLTVASLALLLLPSVREYYRGWSVGDLPGIEHRKCVHGNAIHFYGKYVATVWSSRINCCSGHRRQRIRLQRWVSGSDMRWRSITRPWSSEWTSSRAAR